MKVYQLYSLLSILFIATYTSQLVVPKTETLSELSEKYKALRSKYQFKCQIKFKCKFTEKEVEQDRTDLVYTMMGLQSDLNDKGTILDILERFGVPDAYDSGKGVFKWPNNSGEPIKAGEASLPLDINSIIMPGPFIPLMNTPPPSPETIKLIYYSNFPNEYLYYIVGVDSSKIVESKWNYQK